MNTEITDKNVEEGWLVSLPILLLLTLCLVFRPLVPSWIFMWLLAGSLYLVAKWLTWQRFGAWERRRAPGECSKPDQESPAGRQKLLGYMLAWPGMDALGFFRNRGSGKRLFVTDWIKPILCCLLGAALFWFAACYQIHAAPLARGWSAMVGLVLLLHFGVFHLWALAWLAAGRNAQPIMNRPLSATSLADFWSRRWNRAFSDLTRDLIFRPLARRWGSPPAIFAVFVISGLVHEVVISFPARGGYGLPTAYFILQALGVLMEHKLSGRFGLGRGLRGWFFTVLFVGSPAFWLFHPPFVLNVIVPMLNFINRI